jgi:hypothetical protein
MFSVISDMVYLFNLYDLFYSIFIRVNFIRFSIISYIIVLILVNIIIRLLYLLLYHIFKFISLIDILFSYEY